MKAPSAKTPVWRSSIWSKIGLVIGALYLLNPTAGFFELLPDNLPFVGNLDEATATTLVLYGLGQLKSREKKSVGLRDSP